MQLGSSYQLPVHILYRSIPGRLGGDSSFAESIIAKYRSADDQELPSADFVYPKYGERDAGEALAEVSRQLILMNRIRIQMNVRNYQIMRRYSLTVSARCDQLLNMLQMRTNVYSGVSQASIRELMQIHKELREQIDGRVRPDMSLSEISTAAHVQEENESALIVRILTAASRGNGTRERYMRQLVGRMQSLGMTENRNTYTSVTRTLLSKAEAELFRLPERETGSSMTLWMSEAAKQFFWRIQRTQEPLRSIFLGAGGFSSLVSFEKVLKSMNTESFRAFAETFIERVSATVYEPYERAGRSGAEGEYGDREWLSLYHTAENAAAAIEEGEAGQNGRRGISGSAGLDGAGGIDGLAGRDGIGGNDGLAGGDAFAIYLDHILEQMSDEEWEIFRSELIYANNEGLLEKQAPELYHALTEGKHSISGASHSEEGMQPLSGASRTEEGVQPLSGASRSEEGVQPLSGAGHADEEGQPPRDANYVPEEGNLDISASEGYIQNRAIVEEYIKTADRETFNTVITPLVQRMIAHVSGIDVTQEVTGIIGESEDNMQPVLYPSFERVFAILAEKAGGSVDFNGRDGQAGRQGFRGAAGQSGPHGTEGIAGQSGLQGTGGAAGQGGLRGIEGVAGQSGLQGTGGLAGLYGKAGSGAYDSIEDETLINIVQDQEVLSDYTRELFERQSEEVWELFCSELIYADREGELKEKMPELYQALIEGQRVSESDGSPESSSPLSSRDRIYIQSILKKMDAGTLYAVAGPALLRIAGDASTYGIPEMAEITAWESAANEQLIRYNTVERVFAALSESIGESGHTQDVPDLRIIQNAEGFIGRAGTPGAGGPTGSAGSQGTDGTHGIDGPAGQTGLKGTDGFGGSEGLPGVQGLYGADGPEGLPGVQGLYGADGPEGLPGVQGFYGTDGPEGLPGAQGLYGTDGLEGLPGQNMESGERAVQQIQENFSRYASNLFANQSDEVWELFCAELIYADRDGELRNRTPELYQALTDVLSLPETGQKSTDSIAEESGSVSESTDSDVGSFSQNISSRREVEKIFSSMDQETFHTVVRPLLLRMTDSAFTVLHERSESIRQTDEFVNSLSQFFEEHTDEDWELFRSELIYADRNGDLKEQLPELYETFALRSDGASGQGVRSSGTDDAGTAGSGTHRTGSDESGESGSGPAGDGAFAIRTEYQENPAGQDQASETRREKELLFRILREERGTLRILRTLIIETIRNIAIIRENQKEFLSLAESIMNLTAEQWQAFKQDVRILHREDLDIRNQIPETIIQETISKAKFRSLERNVRQTEEQLSQQEMMREGIRMSSEKMEFIKVLQEETRRHDTVFTDAGRKLFLNTVLRETDTGRLIRPSFRGLTTEGRENWRNFITELMHYDRQGTGQNHTAGGVYFGKLADQYGLSDRNEAAGRERTTTQETALRMLEVRRRERILQAEDIEERWREAERITDTETHTFRLLARRPEAVYSDASEEAPGRAAADMTVPRPAANRETAAATKNAEAILREAERQSRTESTHDIEFETIRHTVTEQRGDDRDLKIFSETLERHEREIAELLKAKKADSERDLPREVMRQINDRLRMERLRNGR